MNKMKSMIRIPILPSDLAVSRSELIIDQLD